MIIATLGPMSFSPLTITSMEEAGVDIFRLNLSHTPIETLPHLIRHVQDCTDRPLCLDTAGSALCHWPAVNSEAVKIARKMGIWQWALSFCRDAQDVMDMKARTGEGKVIIAKVESAIAVENLDGIMNAAVAILVDRGDLSEQVPIEEIPYVQKEIISRANEAGVPCYIATNLMESMVTRDHPNRAEVNDVINTLIDGADGLVLAGETAIGQYPVQCVEMAKRLIDHHQEVLANA